MCARARDPRRHLGRPVRRRTARWRAGYARAALRRRRPRPARDPHGARPRLPVRGAGGGRAVRGGALLVVTGPRRRPAPVDPLLPGGRRRAPGGRRGRRRTTPREGGDLADARGARLAEPRLAPLARRAGSALPLHPLRRARRGALDHDLTDSRLDHLDTWTADLETAVDCSDLPTFVLFAMSQGAGPALDYCAVVTPIGSRAWSSWVATSADCVVGTPTPRPRPS